MVCVELGQELNLNLTVDSSVLRALTFSSSIKSFHLQMANLRSWGELDVVKIFLRRD